MGKSRPRMKTWRFKGAPPNPLLSRWGRVAQGASAPPGRLPKSTHTAAAALSGEMMQPGDNMHRLYGMGTNELAKCHKHPMDSRLCLTLTKLSPAEFSRATGRQCWLTERI